jgi:hypothetical protein
MIVCVYGFLLDVFLSVAYIDAALWMIYGDTLQVVDAGV